MCRYSQIMKWLEEDDFEGVIIFDESHKVCLPLLHDIFCYCCYCYYAHCYETRVSREKTHEIRKSPVCIYRGSTQFQYKLLSFAFLPSMYVYVYVQAKNLGKAQVTKADSKGKSKSKKNRKKISHDYSDEQHEQEARKPEVGDCTSVHVCICVCVRVCVCVCAFITCRKDQGE